MHYKICKDQEQGYLSLGYYHLPKIYKMKTNKFQPINTSIFGILINTHTGQNHENVCFEWINIYWFASLMHFFGLKKYIYKMLF